MATTMSRFGGMALLVTTFVAVRTAAQVPAEFRALVPPSMLDAALRQAILNKAGRYPFVGFHMFGRDSALLVFDDSTLISKGDRAGTWMFGSPVTAAEADSCPPQKVLGRKIARVFWRGWGRPSEVRHIAIAVRGTKGVDRWTSDVMYYQRSELDGPWMGDPER